MRCLRTFALFLAGMSASAVFAQEASDPFPIRRILVPSSQIASEIEKLNQGPTVVLPYDELQRRIAAAAKPTRSESPHLIKATYTAELSGRSLSNGRAQWTIRNSQDPTWMSLPRFGLAISKPRLDGADATLGESGGQPGLWLDRPGTANLTFDWSLRGTQSLSGLAFEFVLPGAPVSTLELRLPGDTAPVAPQSNVLITGPFDSELPKVRIWRLQITGKGNFELLLRPSSVTAGAGSLIAAVEAMHTHQPALLNADFDWQIDVLHHPVQELTFEMDARLQPYDVSIKGPEIREWQTREEKREKGGPVQLLTLRFREPFVGSIAGCKVKCWAPSAPGLMANPGMRLRHAVGRNEKLTLAFHPDLLLESWDSGRFRLASSSAGPNQSLVLTLHDTAPNGPLETRPRYELRSQEAAFAVTEANRWRLGPIAQSLDLDLRIDVSRGKLFQLALKMPGGKWKAEKVRTEPADLIRSWTALGTSLLIDFKQGIDPKTDAKVVASLVSEASLDALSSEWDFPDAEPMQAAVRIGSLSFEVDPAWNALVTRSSVPAAPTLESEQFRFEYRQEKLEGRLKLQARRVRPVIRMEQETTLAERKQSHHLRLDADPVRGAVKTVDVAISPPLPAGAVWRGPDLNSVERLVSEEAGRVVAFAGSPNAWGALATAAASPPMQLWRVKLREPLVRRTALEWTIEAPLPGEVRDPSLPWPVPIALPLHADRGDVKVSLRAPEESLSESRVWGFVPLATTNLDRSVLAWRMIGPTAFGPRLTVMRAARPAGPELLALVDDAKLRISSQPDGRVEHYLSFEVRGWKQPAFPLVLPQSGVEVVGVAIDGRWLPPPEIRQADGKTSILIAAPSLKASWRCEVAYAANMPPTSNALSFRIDPIEPEFPAPTTGLRRQWRLPPDWIPLHQESFSSWRRHKPGLDALRRWWTWGVQAFLPQKGAFHPGLRSLISAEAALRKQSSGDRTLGDIFERLGATVGAGSLVIDAEAMRTLGLAPNSVISASAWSDSQPLWSSVGLVARGVGDAVILTSEAREAAWRTNHGADWSDALSAAIAEAAARGQDASGELQAVDAWTLNSPNAAPPRTLAFMETSDFAGVWTEWSPLHGGPSAPWVAVSVSRLRWSAWLAAVAMALTAWTGRRHLSSVVQFRSLWLMLASLVFGSFWIPISLRDLPFAPIVATFALLAAWHVSNLVGKAGRPTPTVLRRAAPVKAATAIAIAFVGAAASVGQAPPPFAVLLPTDEPNTAYVSTDLLRRLRDLETSRNAAPLGPVVLQASYEGAREGDHFDFEARFDVHAFEERSTWLLPLSGVDLKPGIFLDGAPVLPTPSPKGYVFVLPRKGTQRLTLSFIAKTMVAEGQQEMRFGIPIAWSANVRIQGADLGRDAAFVRCIGEDAVTLDGKGNAVRLKGDLGPESVVHIRWQANVAAPAAKTTIRERYLWDLRSGHFGLTGILQVDPGRPGMTKLELQLPPGLETRSVEVQTLAKSPVPLLKGWRSFDKGNSKWIAVELNQSAATPFRLIASWTPTFPVGVGRVELRMPYPVNAAISESLLGIAVESYEAADRPRNLGVTPLPADTFGKLWLEGGGKESNVVAKAYSFGRESGQAIQGALEATLSPMASAVVAEVDWNVHPHFADVVATATWTSSDELALLEAVVPPEIVLMDIQGAHVHRWNRKGDRVNVWLSQPRRQAVVRFVGWRKHGGGNDAQAALPPIRFVASQVHTQVKATASAGLSVQLHRAAGIKMQALPVDANFVVGNTEAAAYELAVRIRREPQRLHWRVLTAADAHDERGYLVQYVVGQVSHGEMPSFEVTAASRHPLRIDLGGLGVATRLKSSAGEQRWLAAYPGGVGSSVSFSLRGDFAAPTGERVSVPNLKFSTGVVKSEVVAANGLTTTASPPTWAEIKADDGGLVPWKSAFPAAASKGGILWKRNGAETLTLQATSSPAAQNAAVLGASRHWHMTESGAWICDEAFMVAMQTTKSIEAVLPDGAYLMEAQLGGKIVVPFHMGANRIRIDSEMRGLRRLRMLWKKDERETIDAPGSGLHLLGRNKYAVAERIDLPARWVGIDAGSPLAAAWLAEARTLLEASRTLVEMPGDPLSDRGQLLEIQGRLRSLLAWTKTRLSHSSGIDLADRWKQLSQENADLLKKHATQFDVDNSSHGEAGLSAGTVGVPHIRLTRSDSLLPPPNLTWEPDASRPPFFLLQAAALGFALVVVVSYWPRGLTVWTALWPEQAVLLLCVGFWLWGFSLIGAAFLALAIALRIALVVRLIRRGLARWWPTLGPTG
ncbi:MAG: hypothetical protein K2X38_03415 [Gemmataceae bacterium]|nr:hypothetical protein [Gemmataceae bacterium]